jgi:hypothetical protein
MVGAKLRGGGNRGNYKIIFFIIMFKKENLNTILSIKFLKQEKYPALQPSAVKENRSQQHINSFRLNIYFCLF